MLGVYHLHQHVVLANILDFLIVENLLVEWASDLAFLIDLHHALKAQAVPACQRHGLDVLQVIL